MNKFMNARFNSRCAETGQQIKKDSPIFYDARQRKAYGQNSERYKREKEARETGNMIQANEEAFFDNFCQRNGI